MAHFDEPQARGVSGSGLLDGAGAPPSAAGAAPRVVAAAATRSAVPAVSVVGPVLIVDDHQLVGSSVAASLRADGIDARFDPVLSTRGVLAAAGAVAGRARTVDQPDAGLVVLDPDLGRDAHGARIDGLMLVAPLRATGWRVLLLTDSLPGARLGAALAFGAAGWVPKTVPLSTLLAAIHLTAQGKALHSRHRHQELIDLYHRSEREHRHQRAVLATLTPREREVLARLATGQRAYAIAEEFVVAPATVRTQIRAILTKLEVGSQLEAVALYSREYRSWRG
ncbi:MAG: LuxR C-terminal-related transcriptional regulator [Pseudonocardia sp.]|nr:LuxR C-terminal-related transcriptional regulator [Pseudonocardia sp.]